MNNTPIPKTPMLEQYLKIKDRYQNEVLFFRMGDFYEMFLDDAVYASRVLDITLTKRQDQVLMCGFPYHSMYNYIHKILDDGKNIAICEQIEDPLTVKGRIVQRDVIRVLTPGTLVEEELLEQADSSYLAAVIEEKNNIILLLGELSTGELHIEFCKKEQFLGFLETNSVKEVIVSQDSSLFLENEPIVRIVSRDFDKIYSSEREKILQKQFRTKNIDILKLSSTVQDLCVQLFLYIDEVAPKLDIFWQPINAQKITNYMQISDSVVNTLEVLKGQDGKKVSSLFGILNKTLTFQGQRLLKNFLLRPSTNKSTIKKRQEVVEYFVEHHSDMEELRNTLKKCHDIERLLIYLQNKPLLRHLDSLRSSLESLNELKKYFTKSSLENKEIPQKIAEDWNNINDFPELLLETLQISLLIFDLPPVIDERRCFQIGYSSELDTLLDLNDASQEIIANFEAKERKQHNIPSIRIKYNKILGFFIEVSKGQASLVPKSYIRRQTLSNVERFTFEELSNLEEKILSAKDCVVILQQTLFQDLVFSVLENMKVLQRWSSNSSFLDVSLSFSYCAFHYKYIKPNITDGDLLFIKNSRHPVVERVFTKEVFVPNDVYFNATSNHLAILTGPNMAGKSTYIRQIGLIQIMGQIGSFVPATNAEIAIVDKIFTRIGAYDRLFKGESTFYVEMLECVEMLTHFTERSLILLDEVGRGTSTFDGMSIAFSLIEYLNTSSRGKPKILFATHYTELAQMIDSSKGIFGLTVDVSEDKGNIIFLRKVQAGIAHKSYGIYVAEMAGFPSKLIERAKYYLNSLESKSLKSTSSEILEKTSLCLEKKIVTRKDQYKQSDLF